MKRGIEELAHVWFLRFDGDDFEGLVRTIAGILQSVGELVWQQTYRSSGGPAGQPLHQWIGGDPPHCVAILILILDQTKDVGIQLSCSAEKREIAERIAGLLQDKGATLFAQS